MLFRLLLLFVGVPLLELIVLYHVADLTNLPLTIVLIIVTGIIGTWLARSQGFRTWVNIQRELAAGRLPRDSLIDGVMILVAGALLLTPGFLTDIFGFSLLIPYCRRFYRRALSKWFQKRFHVHAEGYDSAHRRSEIIDSYVVENDRPQRLPDDETDDDR